METLFFISKIIVSILFFATAIGMIYLCGHASAMKAKAARLEKLIKEDIKRIYETGSIASKFVVDFIIARYI